MHFFLWVCCYSLLQKFGKDKNSPEGAPHALTLKIRVQCVKHANGKKDDHLWATAEQNQKESSTRTHRPPPNRDETPSPSSSCENVQEKTPLRRVTATPPNKTSFSPGVKKCKCNFILRAQPPVMSPRRCQECRKAPICISFSADSIF